MSKFPHLSDFIKRILGLQLFSRFVLRNHVFSIKAETKNVAFTFDDGPSEQITRDLVDLFVENHGKATFFFQGDRAERFPDSVRYAAAHHFSIGNHSYDHPNYLKLPLSSFLCQIRTTNNILHDITGKTPTMLRPPYNAISQLQSLMVRVHFNQSIINCNIAPTDWCLTDSAQLADFLIKSIIGGAIVCLHDGYPSTLEALRMALPALREKGYKFMSMDEMIEIGTPSPYRNIKINNLHSQPI